MKSFKPGELWAKHQEKMKKHKEKHMKHYKTVSNNASSMSLPGSMSANKFLPKYSPLANSGSTKEMFKKHEKHRKHRKHKKASPMFNSGGEEGGRIENPYRGSNNENATTKMFAKHKHSKNRKHKKSFNTTTKKTGKFEGKSNVLGHGGRAAQLKARGVSGGVIGEMARAAHAAPGQANYHSKHKKHEKKEHKHEKHHKMGKHCKTCSCE